MGTMSGGCGIDDDEPPEDRCQDGNDAEMNRVLKCGGTCLRMVAVTKRFMLDQDIANLVRAFGNGAFTSRNTMYTLEFRFIFFKDK
jgi:hypothetical protein